MPDTEVFTAEGLEEDTIFLPQPPDSRARGKRKVSASLMIPESARQKAIATRFAVICRQQSKAPGCWCHQRRMASLPRGLVLVLDFDGDEGDGLPYYYAHVKPAPEENTETSIHSPSAAPVASAPSHPPIAPALRISSAPSQPPTDPTPQASPAFSHPSTDYVGELLDKYTTCFCLDQTNTELALSGFGVRMRALFQAQPLPLSLEFQVLREIESAEKGSRTLLACNHRKNKRLYLRAWLLLKMSTKWREEGPEVDMFAELRSHLQHMREQPLSEWDPEDEYCALIAFKHAMSCSGSIASYVALPPEL
ncbi:hypothetical protein CNMCM5793_000201 [Aspergillus hiratsukae]|uniref:Uncharacterized protein n=1 Tax=Aspergillus hiratsukae TaxID=1194566 RepID=A0A8H6Q0Y1_9EURO|nr:hypothetical protein CNMCM5793_000201 [Aspergillus hiratsukae]KAF7164043.1 hypothetical protein CNMCM6106_000737 [Aspergillus hiratsukae]